MASAPAGPGPTLPFRFSKPLLPAEVRASGTLTLLPLRMHSMEDAVASTANRDLKEEWTAAHGKPPSGAACESPHGHLAPFALPECLPERMYMCAYIMDYMLWHDNLADDDRDVDKSKGMSARQTLCADFKGETNSTSTSPTPHASESLERRMIHHLLALDQPAASALRQEWERYATYSAETFAKEFLTLDEYIAHRFYDAGLLLYYAVSGFATACLPLTPAEQSLAMPLISCLGHACALTNDYYSWDKEFAAHAAAGGHGRVYNCVALIMVKYNCDIDTARELLRERIQGYERQFQEMWLDWEENGVVVEAEDEGNVDVERVRCYVRAAMFATSGSAYWHARAPRYNGGEWGRVAGA
ncbi:isoprenoid synthase domain-containing protein [Mycena alexandri]|uniref:Isoprenoid synthase domain-containing protein n=1 Tax=Mycena alexandri TaxID=1745969 RepID=A0AAD6S5C0_9AGAR|nr:isoprenoid synthase domain-containing protein [Mycena alexandri]